MGEGKNAGYSGWQNKSGFGTKPKDLLMIPARVALALQADGWWLRSDIIWHKPNAMPESVTDRPTSAHEHVFLLSKSERYFYDADAIREAFTTEMRGEPHSKAYGRKTKDDKADRAATGSSGAGFVRNDGGRNARNVWTIATQPFGEAHFATMAPDLAERCIKAGTKPGDAVLDPFGGAGTTGLVADRLNRHAVLIELNPEYAAMAERRLSQDAGLFADLLTSPAAAPAQAAE
jgi:DNA modification methylase